MAKVPVVVVECLVAGMARIDGLAKWVELPHDVEFTVEPQSHRRKELVSVSPHVIVPDGLAILPGRERHNGQLQGHDVPETKLVFRVGA